LLRRLHALRVDFKACFWITIYEPAAPATTINEQPHKKRRGLARLTSARKFFTFISSAKGRIQSAERAVPTFSSTIRRIFFPA
jgi:hypothetical protein